MGTEEGEQRHVACPECSAPMTWSVVAEAWWCMCCPNASDIKNWIFLDGKLVKVDLLEHFKELDKRAD